MFLQVEHVHSPAMILRRTTLGKSGEASFSLVHFAKNIDPIFANVNAEDPYGSTSREIIQTIQASIPDIDFTLDSICSRVR